MELAISIRQPYTEMILRGIKTVEFRSYPTNVRGRVMLYATKKLAESNSLLYEAEKAGIVLADLPMGKIVGSVEIVDCQDYDHGLYGYVLRKPKRYDVPWQAFGHPQPCFWKPQI